MAGAKIGALHVQLGINTAQFSAGLKGAQTNLAKFGKTVAVGFAAVATAAAAAGVAMGVSVKGAIDTADAMSKAAQKAGVTTEALSRLAYAADFSDVSLEQLTGGLGRLSKTMLDVAGGSKGPAATAFKALGISVTDAAGKLRASDAVFADIADRFGRLENGTTKTALAMALFGKAGAEMIPLLNEGSDGLKRFADESDRTGNTISTNTGKAAEKFNDTLTAIQKSVNGVVIRMTEYLLPSMQDIATFMASPEFAAAAQGFGEAIASGVKVAFDVVVGLSAAIRDLFNYVASKAAPGTSPLDAISVEDLQGRIANSKRIIDRRKASGADLGNLEKTLAEEQAALFRRQYSDPVGLGTGGFAQVLGMKMGGTTTTPPPTKPPVDFTKLTSGASTAKTAMVDLMAGIDDAKPKVEDFAKTISDSLANAFTGFADAVMSGVPAVQALSDMLGDLGKQLLNSAISNFFGNLFGGGFGGGFSMPGRMPGTANLLNVGSFAGGGYTGSGSRSGGMDGMGGFPAILHPNETVIDHSRGGGGAVQNFYIDAKGGEIGVEKKIVQAIQSMVPTMIDTRAPAAVAKTQRNRSL